MNRIERRERKGKNLFLFPLRSLWFNRRSILSCAPGGRRGKYEIDTAISWHTVIAWHLRWQKKMRRSLSGCSNWDDSTIRAKSCGKHSEEWSVRRDLTS